MTDREKSLRKNGVRMVVRHKNPGIGPVDHKEHGTPGPVGGERSEISQMAGTSFRDCIGKHGHLIPKEGTRFHLKNRLFLTIMKKKIESASPPGDLRSSDPCPLQTRNKSMVQKEAGHIIGPMGVEHDGHALSFNRYGGIPGLSRLPPLLPHNIDAFTRQEKFLKSTRVGQKGIDKAAAFFATNRESIETGDKASSRRSVEEYRLGQKPVIPRWSLQLSNHPVLICQLISSNGFCEGRPARVESLQSTSIGAY